MKVAVLTLTPSNNYGGILQAVALYHYLESIGCDVTLINKKFHIPFWKRIVFKCFSVIPFYDFKNKRRDKKKTKQLKEFIEKYIPKRSRPIVSLDDLQKLVQEECYDAVIVGSDQVWRYQYIKDDFLSVFFLGFQVDFPVKKIAYAASFGTDNWELSEDTSNVSKYLRDFSAVSVREDSGVRICREFGVDSVQHVLDPTLIVSRDFYDKLLGENKNVVRNTPLLTTYILDDSLMNEQLIANVKTYLGSSCGLEQINLSDCSDGRFYSVDEWLLHIKDADFIVTDSFHGTVFSIIFQKQFIVVGNSQRGLSRFNSLLEQFDLKHRLVSGDIDNIGPLIQEKIDYSKIDMTKILAESRGFLEQALFD